MVGPFSKKPISADEWQSKARIFQAQLEGLTIDELMRGPIGDAHAPAQRAVIAATHSINRGRPKVTPMEGSGYAPATPTAGSHA